MSDDLKKSYQSIRLMNLLLLVIVFVDLAVVELVKAYGASVVPVIGDKSIVRIVRYFLIGFVVVDVIMIRFLRNMPSRGRTRDPVTREGLIKRLSTVQFIIAAISCSVAANGLVLFFLSGRSADFYLFFVASLILMKVNFPKYDDWEERIKALSVQLIRESSYSE